MACVANSKRHLDNSADDGASVHLDSLAEVKQHDLVTMKNWDHLTGHVKKLESGVLYIDLDYVSGSLGVDWLELEKVESAGGFPVLFKNGDGLQGRSVRFRKPRPQGKILRCVPGQGTFTLRRQTL